MAYYKAQFGEERTSVIFERRWQTGREVGIDFRYGGRAGHTRDSHRLIQPGETKSPALHHPVVERLFAACIEGEGDITDREVLLGTAVEAGLDKSEAEGWLEGDRRGPAVDEEVARVKLNGISRVPAFTWAGK